MPSPRETILTALHSQLQMLPATALRGEVLPERIPADGLVILRDGEPGEPEMTLSPLRYHYQHRAEVEAVVQGADRDAAFDTLTASIGTALAADRRGRALRLGRGGGAAAGRSGAEWEKWFERRETKKRKKRGSKSEAKTLPRTPSRVGVPPARVIGEPSFFNASWKRSKILEFTDYRRANPTPAETELSRILNALNDGVLRRKFVREHVISGRWIVDFFFPEIRLAIEVDGSIHLTGHQLRKDKHQGCRLREVRHHRPKGHKLRGVRAQRTADRETSLWLARGAVATKSSNWAFRRRVLRA